jgi:hypothetical protein
MKRSLLFASTILLFVISFTACKKDDESTKPLRTKIIGKWKVDKVDVTTYSNVEAPVIVSTNYGAADYIDFKDNTSDDVELGLGSSRQVGTFAVYLEDSFFIDFSSKDLSCVINVLNDNKLQFTGTVVGANPKVTETYYLSR